MYAVFDRPPNQNALFVIIRYRENVVSDVGHRRGPIRPLLNEK